MVLVIGASGRIGSYLYTKFIHDGIDIVGTYCNNKKPNLIHFDLSSMNLIDLNLSPSHVIFCGALNTTPELSKVQADSYNVNVPKTIKLLEECFENDIVPIYISTDNVFDGVKGNYKEDDETNPLNNYGKMKCEVESHLLTSQNPFFLLRMGKVFGIDDTLFLETYNNLSTGIEKQYATDQVFTPLYAEDLYEFLKVIIDGNYQGIYHLGSMKAVSRYEVAKSIKKYFGFDTEVVPVRINDLNLSEMRPINIDLNIEKYLGITGKKERELEYFFEKVIVGLDPDKWKRDSSGNSLAYFAKTRQVAVSSEMIDELLLISKNMGNANVRFCLHSSPDDDLQDMVVLVYKDKICRRLHQHKTSNEAIHIIQGKALALIFDEQSNLIDKRVLDSNGEFAYRNAQGTFHTYFPLTDYVVLREIRYQKYGVDYVLPEWDWTEVMETHLPQEDLTCYNKFCKTPCRFLEQGVH